MSSTPRVNAPIAELSSRIRLFEYAVDGKKLSPDDLESYQVYVDGLIDNLGTYNDNSMATFLSRLSELQALIYQAQGLEEDATTELEYARKYVNSDGFVSNAAKAWARGNSPDVKQPTSQSTPSAAGRSPVARPDHRGVVWTTEISGRGLSADSPWNALRHKVFARDNYKCIACGETQNLTVDHIKELSVGGSNDMSNLRTLCKDCHQKKHLRRFLERDFDADDNYGQDYKVTPKIATLDKALREKKAVPIKYVDNYGVRSFRVIHPKRIWRDPYNHKVYVEAYCELDKDKRTFKIAKIELTTGNRSEYLDEPVYGKK